jgi:uncharacterized protein (DUF362 family)
MIEYLPRPRVALLRCESYSRSLVKDRILEGLDLIGYDLSSLNGSRVALKPNLLSAVDPASAIVTHPEIFRAAAEIVLDHGGRPMLLESPAVASLGSALAATGYQRIIDELSIEVASAKGTLTIAYEQGKVYKYFEVIPELLQADVIMNLPKFKTHELTYITGAVKNLFGLVPGLRKSQMHIRFSDKESFGEYLLDLYGAVSFGFKPSKPVLHLMDAVIALEGQGPGSSGRPRMMGAVLVSEDGLALDYIATMVAGLDVAQHQTVLSGFARGFSPGGPEAITVLGELVAAIKVDGFVPAGTAKMPRFMYKIAASKTMKDLFIARPVPEAGKCTLCYQCREICPAGAIERASHDEKTPRFDYRKCIRCFCCMEVCGYKAVGLRRGILQWMLRL